ncbi:MAG: class I SAM-dependent methyltransferase [Candidatus Absconditabacteria bacterium]
MKTLFSKLSSLEVKTMSHEDLEKFLPELGMNDEILHEMPSELSSYFGFGLKFWQYPNQLSKFLKYICDKEINSYIEIGCRWGGTFVIINEILRKTNANIKSFAVDLIDQSDILKSYEEYTPFSFLQGNSNDEAWLLSNLPEQVDLIFIDGDHSYLGLKRDYEIALKLKPKYIMFHDISSAACPDVVKFWNEIKQQYSHVEFIDQYSSVPDDYLGIGVIEMN